MKTSVSTALRRLREADPAAGAATRQSTVEFTARETELVPVRRRPARMQMAAAAAAVVVVAGAVGGVVGLNRHGGLTGDGCARVGAPAPAEPEFGPNGTLYCSEDPHYAAALAAVEQALASLPQLPGSVRVASAPTKSLQQPPMYPSSGNLVDRVAFWTAPGTVPQAFEYFKAHPPAAMGNIYATTTSDDPEGREDISFGLFEVGSPPMVDFAIVAHGAGVAVRVDVATMWVPTKPTGAYLGQVDSVDITVQRPGSTVDTVQRTLTGAPAQRLADAIDMLQPSTSGIRHCPMMRGFVDDLVFHVGTRSIHVVNIVDGCQGVTIDFSPQVNLDGSIDEQVTTSLGLPTNYGFAPAT